MTTKCTAWSWIGSWTGLNSNYQRLYCHTDKTRQQSYINDIKPSVLISVLYLCKRAALLGNKYPLKYFMAKVPEVSSLLSNDLGKLSANIQSVCVCVYPRKRRKEVRRKEMIKNRAKCKQLVIRLQGICKFLVSFLQLWCKFEIISKEKWAHTLYPNLTPKIYHLDYFLQNERQ